MMPPDMFSSTKMMEDISFCSNRMEEIQKNTNEVQDKKGKEGNLSAREKLHNKTILYET